MYINKIPASSVGFLLHILNIYITLVLRSTQDMKVSMVALRSEQETRILNPNNDLTL